jgi:hypothetical protein
VKERPILFSTSMVRAILDGRKTQTRRLRFRADPGDTLWVRESWRPSDKLGVHVEYLADTPRAYGRWKPSIHLRRCHARLFLEVLAVREEPLAAITVEDVFDEGLEPGPSGAYVVDDGTDDTVEREDPIEAFALLWDSINGKRAPWSSNPRVTVVEFRRLGG